MAKTLFHFASDAVLWAACIVLTGFLSASGLIENPAFALAGSALWFAIRAYRKADVNSVRKSEIEG